MASDVTVRGCAECPWSVLRGCTKEERDFTTKEEAALFSRQPPPSWCPLRPEHGGPLTVRLEVRDA